MATTTFCTSELDKIFMFFFSTGQNAIFCAWHHVTLHTIFYQRILTNYVHCHQSPNNNNTQRRLVNSNGVCIPLEFTSLLTPSQERLIDKVSGNLIAQEPWKHDEEL